MCKLLMLPSLFLFAFLTLTPKMLTMAPLVPRGCSADMEATQVGSVVLGRVHG